MSDSAAEESDGEVGVALTDWGFAELIPYFTKQEIDFKLFQSLTKDDLVKIMPLGKVLKFHPVYEREVSALRKRKRVDSEPNLASTSTLSLSSSSLDKAGPSRSSSSSPTTGDAREEVTVIGNDDEDVDAQLVLDLKRLFNYTLNGQILLLTKSDDITDQDRNDIASIIVCNELRKSSNKTINSERLIELARATATVFDSESSAIYYTPYRKVKDKVFTAKGKFCTQLYAWRKRAIDVGMIDPGSSFNKSKAVTSSKCTVPVDAQKAIDWLKVNLGPPSTASLHWRASFEFRDQFLVSFNDLGAIEVYFNTFPILRQPKLGLELMLQDFLQNVKLSETANNFTKYWPTFSERFLKKLNSKIIPAQELDELKLLFEKEKGVNVCHHLLLHFSRIFPTPVVVKGRKPNHWTPTKAEAQLGFLGHYHTEEDFKTSLHDKIKRLSSFQKPLSFQPFAAIVGPNVRRVQKCYVVVQPNDIYEVDSPFEAIDNALKACHVLDAKYPHESKLLWLTLQQGVYKLFTENDEDIITPQLLPILKYFNKD